MNKNKLSIGFALLEIKEMQFSVFPNALKANSVIKQNIKFAFGVEVSDRIIACGCTYSLLAEGNYLLHIEVVCQFQIEENKWSEDMCNAEANIFVLPGLFAEHLASIVASTTRGVLYANTKGTEFSSYPMSLIDVHQILKAKDIEITMGK